jgi:hypothetical protein
MEKPGGGCDDEYGSEGEQGLGNACGAFFLNFFLSCEKKVVLLYRNLTAVKFTDIKE